MDEHSSQQHQNQLKEFVEQLPSILNKDNLEITVAFVQSHSFIDLQLCDLVTGAAGWLGNKQHDIRRVGDNGKVRRGMTKKQKAKLELAKSIQTHLRSIDKEDRGSGAFDWWGSTGNNGNDKNALLHRFRTWCFHPKQGDYLIDKGWEKDNLGSNNSYQGQQLVDPDNHSWHKPL
ncbi:MAG: hypothetical protein L3J82_00775 [Planctomycetes bacterium]|nr:hypothetical protein [Planctomycetota bacterium]